MEESLGPRLCLIRENSLETKDINEQFALKVEGSKLGSIQASSGIHSRGRGRGAAESVVLLWPVTHHFVRGRGIQFKLWHLLSVPYSTLLPLVISRQPHLLCQGKTQHVLSFISVSERPTPVQEFFLLSFNSLTLCLRMVVPPAILSLPTPSIFSISLSLLAPSH